MRVGADAVGARVTLRVAGRAIARTIDRGTSYLSSSEAVAHFGIAASDARPEDAVLEVRWPDGGVPELFDVERFDTRVVVTRGEGRSP